MKYIYVLASSAEDFFYEQFLISVFSLRKFNPDADILLLTDSVTAGGLKGKRTAYSRYISAEKVIECSAEMNQKECSRWIKTSIGSLVDGEFIYIDCDTVICGILDFNPPAGLVIGAIPDTHVPLTANYQKDVFIRDNKKLGFSAGQTVDGIINYYNGGIIYSDGSPQSKDFFKKWHELWLKSRELGNTQDMPSLNEANIRCGNIIHEISGIWNCQINYNGLPFLNSAKIIHYYATSLVSFSTSFLPASDYSLNSVKETGEIRGRLALMLEDPKSAFAPDSRVIADKIVLDILDSAYFSKLLWLRRKHENMFFIFNRVIGNIKKPGYLVQKLIKR